MNLWSVTRTNSSPLRLPPPITSRSSKPQSLRIHQSTSPLPARDRVIDFGKYKGQMLGTLPSTYLKWVSKNLRARDFEEWARLADQVLEDPVYKDRIEWEFAQKVLNGDSLGSSLFSRGSQQSSVAELAEISERFGWDNEDKVGWAKVDFGLLGTSKGRRIPRLSSSGPRPYYVASTATVKPNMRENKVGSADHDFGLLQGSKGRNIPRLSSFGPKPDVVDPRQSALGERDKRRERRERVKLRLEARDHEGEFGNSHDTLFTTKAKGNVDKEENAVANSKKGLFPGREALLKKVLRRGDRLK